MFTLLSPTASAQDAPVAQRADIQSGIQRLKTDTAGAAKVSVNPATGAARFVRIASGSEASFSRGMSGTAAEKSAAFFSNYGAAFGVTNPATQLKAAGEIKDETGGQHLTYKQVYMGVPVFAGLLRTHFDASGELRSVNGNFIPDISLNPVPSRDANEAAARAIEQVKASIAEDNGSQDLTAPRSTEGLSAQKNTLVIFRENLTLRIPGANHLAWEIIVGNGTDVREFVYVDAHTGKVAGQYTGTYDALNRRAFDGQGSTSVPPPNYPNNPFWVEGQPFPTGNAEANNMITSSGEVYNYYKNAYGRSSFDNNDATMDAIFNRGNACPNASWNGLFISFCPGLTTDDVTAHEWSHAFTEYTHGLIYAHQSGALNEAWSDIHGETVDQINGRDNVGNSGTDPLRADGACSRNGTPPPVLTISNSSTANGTYFARASVNEPARPFTVGPTAMSTTVPAGACTAITNNVSGKIAVIDWTLLQNGANECGSGTRATNAINAGAAGIIYVAPAAGLLNIGSNAAIGSVEVTRADGTTIINGLPGDATMTLGVASDTSTRWLLGEDDTGALANALRDMWNPRCFGNPGKVSDMEYSCAAQPSGSNDQGGVHNNSGVINHEYALIVDGGTYNGQTITGIGLTKAAQIFFRAQNLYQHPSTDFADHGDAIEQAATDFINAGTNLPKLTDGTPSGEVVTAADLAQIQKAELAVELRTVPAACASTPLLGQNPPADACGSGTVQKTIFSDDFEGDTSSWSVSHVANNPAGFTVRDWAVSSDLPDGRAGKAFFGVDPPFGSCIGNSNEAGIIHLTSPSIHIPSTATNRTLRFDHWVSLERNFDGGQLRVSTDGGNTFTLVPQANYLYNAPNVTLPSGATVFDNPMAGQRAFSGYDSFTSDGSWATSVVDLGSLAPAGSDIVLRWSVGTDCGSGAVGWYIDNVKLSTCIVDTDLSIIKKASATSTVIGNNVTYTLTVKNNGPTNATSVVIHDPLPTGLSFVSADGGCMEDGGTVTCNIGDLANGASVVRHITAKTTKIGKIINTANVTLFEPDTVVPGNNSGGAAVNVLAWLRSFTFTPGSVIGGCANSTGKILLNAPAPAGGLDVALTSGDADVSVPSMVHFNQGDTQQTFMATTSAVHAVKTVNVSAKVVGTTTALIGRLQLKPVPIVTVSFSPNPVTGGSPTTGTVTLSCAAPYNITVNLVSNKAAATPQSSVMIPQGQSSAPFNVTTKSVLSQTAVTITAKGNGSVKTGVLTVNPAP